MCQDILSITLGGNADLLSASYGMFDTSQDDWLSSSCDVTVFPDLDQQACLTGQTILGMGSERVSVDPLLPFLLSPDEVHTNWANSPDSHFSRPSSSEADFHRTVGRVLSVTPPSPSSPSPAVLSQPHPCASSPPASGTDLEFIRSTSPDTYASSDSDTATSTTRDSEAQLRRRSTCRRNPSSSSNNTKRKSKFQRHWKPHRDDTSVVGPPPIKRKRDRIPHNEVEKRYRYSLNHELHRLQMAVPHLAGSGSSADSDEFSRPSSTKATVIASAVHYIKAIEAERDALRAGMVGGSVKIV